MKLLESEFPAWRIETLADLGKDYKKLWLGKHAKECPGLASGHFHGNNAESYAALLVPRGTETHGLKIVVLSQSKDGAFLAKVLENLTEPTTTPLLVSRVAPGEYFDAVRWRNIRIETDSIFVEQLEVAGRLWYWKEGRFTKITTSY